MPIDKLTDSQRACIVGAHELLRATAEHNRAHPHRRAVSLELWSDVDSVRTHREILIDGDRGTGKTATMLTMLNAWSSELSEEDCSDPVRREHFQWARRSVRALPPLDFDPLPPDMPVYAWLVAALEPLVDAAAQERHASFRHALSHGGLDSEGPDLRDKWTALYQDVVLGWVPEALRSALQGDIDEFALDSHIHGREVPPVRSTTSDGPSGSDRPRPPPAEGLCPSPWASEARGTRIRAVGGSLGVEGFGEPQATMRYSDGTEVLLGDAVVIGAHDRGVVVADLDRGEFDADHPREAWDYLERGAVIDTGFGGLVHYTEPLGDVVLLVSRRGTGNAQRR